MHTNARRRIIVTRMVLLAPAVLMAAVLFALIPPAGGFLESSAAPAPGGPPIGVGIKIDTTTGFPLTEGDRLQLFQRLASVVNFQSQKSTWACVRLPALDVKNLAELAPLVPIRLHIDVLLGAAPGGEANVLVEVTVEGQKGAKQLRGELGRVAAGRLDTRGLGDEAARLLEPMLEKTFPCSFRPKVKGKVTVRSPLGGTERSYNGETDLALRADGSFQGTMTIPDSWVTTLTQPGIASCRTTESGGSCTFTAPQTGAQMVCTLTRKPGALRLEIAGQYRAQDATLSIERMDGTDEQGGTTGSCTPAPPYLASFTAEPPSSMTGNILAGSGGLVVALADGAEVALPQPAGFTGTWDVKLQVEYPGGAGVSSRSPVQPARTAALVRRAASPSK